MMTEQSLLTRLEAIVQTLEDDKDVQRIPLEQLDTYKKEADTLCDALMTLYKGATVDEASPPPVTPMLVEDVNAQSPSR